VRRDNPAISDALRAGRRSVDGLPGVTLLTDFQWDPEVSVWFLRVKLEIPESSDRVPSKTDWIIHAAAQYPLGEVKVYPARDNGIEGTFPHQALNVRVPESLWRTGALCLEPLDAETGSRSSEEPRQADSRLGWHVLRAQQWLEAAATGTLTKPGDRFELPQFVDLEPPIVAFADGPEHWQSWLTAAAQGVAELVRLGPEYLVVRRWFDMAGKAILIPEWGTTVSDAPRGLSAFWIRVPKVPVHPPWQAPLTWGELRRAIADGGGNLDTLLQSVLPRLRGDARSILLVGFPMPRVIGGPNVEMHWQPLMLPPIPRHGNVPNGLRNNQKGLWIRDRDRVFGDKSGIFWHKAENWQRDRLLARGHFEAAVRDTHYAVLGVGAIGAAVASHLCRGGATHMSLIDGDKLRAGNLVRHDLTLDGVGQSKAQMMASRLSAVSPYSTVGAEPNDIGHSSEEAVSALDAFDVIIDCSASSDLLQVLAGCTWKVPKVFISVSLALGGRRLLFFSASGQSFPVNDFNRLVQAWIKAPAGSESSRLVWEGPGCWHLLFPARYDDVTLAVATATKLIEKVVSDVPTTSELVVFDQKSDGSRFSGFHLTTVETA